MAIIHAGSLVRFTHNRRVRRSARDGSPVRASAIFVPKGTFGIVLANTYYAHVFVATGGYVYVSPYWLEVMVE